jgi:hypothetical protein
VIQKLKSARILIISNLQIVSSFFLRPKKKDCWNKHSWILECYRSTILWIILCYWELPKVKPEEEGARDKENRTNRQYKIGNM